jgi:hypothetical protein
VAALVLSLSSAAAVLADAGADAAATAAAVCELGRAALTAGARVSSLALPARGATITAVPTETGSSLVAVLESLPLRTQSADTGSDVGTGVLQSAGARTETVVRLDLLPTPGGGPGSALLGPGAPLWIRAGPAAGDKDATAGEQLWRRITYKVRELDWHEALFLPADSHLYRISSDLFSHFCLFSSPRIFCRAPPF